MSERLPIYQIEFELVSRLRQQRRMIVSAPTGSGKSTQIPQMLLRHGYLSHGQAMVLQPRRLAARMLAARVAEELNCRLGEDVGYTVRFENVSNPRTRIRFVTEGVLLRQMLQEPSLPGVTVLVFDEFHERHLYGDLTLAQALELQERQRPDLIILVMSATLDVHGISEYLNRWSRPPPPPWQAGCAVVESAGGLHPVKIHYWDECPEKENKPVWEKAAEAFARYIRGGGCGNVLIFMPGVYEIQQTLRALESRPESAGYTLLPLHGDLPPHQQEAAVRPSNRPKVVVATNVAETSLTIQGIHLVIDSGLARIPRYDPVRGLNTLWIEPISRASADQRAGRAGRTGPGLCIRLWSQREHQARPERELPEIQRVELAEGVLMLKAAGVEDLQAFRWLEAPDPKALKRAEALLLELGALEPAADSSLPPCEPVSLGQLRTRITPMGRRMLAFPLHPRYGRMLLEAERWQCVREACLAAALTQERDLLRRNPPPEVVRLRDRLLGNRHISDFHQRMRAWEYICSREFDPELCERLGIHRNVALRVAQLFKQFVEIARLNGLKLSGPPAPETGLARAILAAFPDHLARRLDTGTARCELIGGRRATLDFESVVQSAPLLVSAEIREIESSSRDTTEIVLAMVCPVEPDWVREMFPSDVSNSVHCDFDPVSRRVVAEVRTTYRGLVIEQRRLDPPPPEQAAQLLATEVIAGRLVLKSWDDAVEQWIARVNFLARTCPELGLPAFDEEARRSVVEAICHGASSYKEIKEREVAPLVHSWLSEKQQALLDRHAPERIALANGRNPKVRYSAEGPPTISLRIQDLYGLTEPPRIAMGRVTVVVQILSPGMKPIQTTQDLAGFWREHYPRLKQELQRRYPKHEWR
ncbi:MAG: ATP-dependent helicase HrpB [Verrucomicrobiota bacterium]|nr:ATP-dependent helicase HrpB [Limisphaera sp.]MDW8381634.1 ATP-dependent helicase HrpB [Verrucomicrobiota bacterium]